MNPLEALLRANPGLAVVLALVLLGGAVFAAMAWALRRQPVARRGVAFVAGFFAIVLLPQLLGQLALAVRPAALPAAPAADGPMLQGDAAQHAIHAPHMPGLRSAASADGGAGRQRLRLVFADEAAAAAGLLAYAQLHALAPTLDRGGVELVGPRGLGGGWARLRRDGSRLTIDTALDEAGLSQGWPLVGATGAAQEAPAVPEPLLPALQPVVRAFQGSVPLQLAGVLLALAVAVGWLFAGIAWAGRVPAAGGVAPLPVAQLQQRLLALADGEWPLQAEQLPDGRIAIGWRHDDLRWLDAAGLHAQGRTDRLLLRLDAARHCVHVLEQWSRFSADAGAGGAQLQWQAARGIRFFEREQHTVVGLQLDAQGRPTGAWQHTRRVDLQALKAPVVAAVTGAGWRWQPVLLDRG